MILIAFVLVNFLVFAAWYLFLLGRSRRGGHVAPMGESAAYAGLLSMCQVVLLELALGAAGLFRLPLLVGVVLTVSVAVLAWTLMRSDLPGAIRARSSTGNPLAKVRQVFDLPAVLLIVLVVFVSLWMLVATWLLPPRGADDIVYHLPPLYEMVQTGHLTLLPIQIRPQFAMPLGGDFLFLWPLVFFHADTWIDGMQFLVALFGIVVVGALAKALGAGAKDAAFAGLLWLFIPVVLAQSASNYVDVIVAVVHLLMLYAAVRFWQTGRWMHLVMAGLAAGFGLGVKYNLLVAVAAVLPIPVVRLWRDGRLPAVLRGGGLLALLAVPFSAYWPIRNWLVTGHPLFPYQLGVGGLKDLDAASITVSTVTEGRALAVLVEQPVRLLTYLFEDPGLGSLNGGLGIVFWGLGVPALIWGLIQAGRSVRLNGDWLPLLVFAQVIPVILVFLMQTDVLRLRFNMRLTVVAAALGLVALALFLAQLRKDAPAAATGLRYVGMAASVLALLSLATSPLPSMQIGPAIADRARDSATSQYRYYRQYPGDMRELGAAFETVDFLTRGGGGWEVALAAEWRVFNTAPMYGTGLQNRVWNFPSRPRGLPDACIFQQTPAGVGLYYPWPENRIILEDVRRDGRYERVPLPTSAELWVRRERLTEPVVRARLAEFQRRTAVGE